MTVSEYLHEHLGEDAAGLEEQFTNLYNSVLQQHDSIDTEISKLHILIKEFKPTLSSILQPGEHFEKLMGMVLVLLAIQRFLDGVEQYVATF